jgi:hypothetical protein
MDDPRDIDDAVEMAIEVVKKSKAIKLGRIKWKKKARKVWS